MKEKLIAIITLGFIFSLFFYYKVINPVENEIASSSINNHEKTSEIEVIKDSNITLVDEIAIEEKNENNNCNLDVNKTNQMDFSSAFKYYRDCNGSDSKFAWNDNLYSTILLSEVKSSPLILQVHQVEFKQKDNDNNYVVDKKHLQLQNSIIGDNSKTE